MPERKYSRQPDTLLMLGGLAVAGVFLTVTAELPASVSEVVPKWAGLVWSLCLSLGAGASLAGLYLKDSMNGLLTIVVGRTVLSGTLLAYSVALLTSTTSWGSVLIIVLVTSLAVSCALAARKAAKQIRQIAELVRHT